MLDYILSQVDEGECPFVQVNIFGIPLFGLLDSGTNKVFMNLEGWQIFKNLGVKLVKPGGNVLCRVANNKECQCLGIVRLPIQLKQLVKVFEVYIFPELRHTLVLGIDFWKRMGVVPDVRKGEWYFAAENLNEPILNSISVEPDLNFEELEKLNNIVDAYFSKVDPNKLGKCTLVRHRIRIPPNTEPIKQRYYPVSPAKQAIINQEIDKMLDLGVIEKSKSGWSSPCLLVPKSNGTWRFCADLRKVNKISERDAYPLPYVADHFRKLGDAKYFSTLDFKSAYWQIELEPDSRKFTAFTVPGRGLFQFVRMPYGLQDAPATFQRLVDDLFDSDIEPYVLRYIDDIIICTSTLDKHFEVLGKVLARLLEVGLSLNREKCHFCFPELKFLGHVVGRSGIAVDPAKVEAIVNLSRPQTVREVRRVIGMISWYRRFVDGFSEMTGPLSALLRKGKKFVWTDECEVAFQKIKDALVSAPILASPNFNYPFYVQTDASTFGLGAVLTQQYNNREYVICYLSRTLSKAESRYASVELECLAVLWAVEKLKCYLELTKFYIVTDCSSLKWLENLKDPQGRLGRWALRLQQFNYEIIHRRGKDHIIPDALSRAPLQEKIGVSAELSNIEVADTEDEWYCNMRKRIQDFPLKYSRWRVDDDKVFKYVVTGFPELREDTDFWKLVVPKNKRGEILKRYHDDTTAGHLGIYKTFSRIARLFYWPGMKSDIARYVRRCRTCLRTKPEQKRPAGFMGKPLVASRCWEVVSTDLCGPFPRSSHGNQFILVVTDTFSKFSLFFALRKATATAVTRIIKEQVFMVFGVPRHLKTDNGVQFRSREFFNLCSSFGVKIIFNPNYSPQCNPTERVNRVLKGMLSAYVHDNQRKWDECLAELGCAYRSARHEVTGVTPYFLNLGQEMIVHAEEYMVRPNNVSEVRRTLDKVAGIEKLRAFVRKRLVKASEKSRDQFNLRRRNVDYQVGDVVWKRQFLLSNAANYFNAKLAGKFCGPFKIKRKIGYCVYELEDENGVSIGNWHVKDLKPDPGGVEGNDQ